MHSTNLYLASRVNEVLTKIRDTAVLYWSFPSGWKRTVDNQRKDVHTIGSLTLLLRLSLPLLKEPKAGVRCAQVPP